MIETSIQYQLTNNVLFNEVVYNWKNFNSHLMKGPDAMTDFFLELWERTKSVMVEDKNLKIKDLNKEVTSKDFKTYLYRGVHGEPAFYFIFPKYDDTDAACVMVGLVLTKEKPRYFTMESSLDFLRNKRCWVIGEWDIENNQKIHRNYGRTVDFTSFIDDVNKIMTEEGKKN